MSPEVGFSAFIATLFALLAAGTGVALTLALEEQEKKYSVNTFLWCLVGYFFFGWLGMFVNFSIGWCVPAAIWGGYLLGAGIPLLSSKSRVGSRMEFARKLSGLGANLLEEYDLDHDGIISPADASRIYKTAPSNSDKQRFAGMLLNQMRSIGHNIASDGADRFCVISLADVPGYVARVEKIHASWFGTSSNGDNTQSKQ